MARVSRLARVGALGLLGGLTLTGCDLNNAFWRFGWPEGITKQATEMRHLTSALNVIANIAWFGFLACALFLIVASVATLMRHRTGTRRT